MAEADKQHSAVEAPAFTVDDEELALINRALHEDKGPGDWTTRWIVPARARARARIIAQADGVLAGLAIASATFQRLDARMDITSSCSDGDAIHVGDIVCRIDGPARAILTGERTALNFLQRLSGIATRTRDYVNAVAGTGAVILDTRQTAPGWRALQKNAVKAGGGQNHRFGLYDMVLIKAGHIAIAGGVKEALRRAHDANNRDLRVVVEVTSKDELKAALDAGCDRIRLTAMDVQAIREAVRIVRKTSEAIEIEATGNMTLDRVRAVAEAGVGFISVADLTHNAPPLDLTLELTAE